MDIHRVFTPLRDPGEHGGPPRIAPEEPVPLLHQETMVGKVTGHFFIEDDLGDQPGQQIIGTPDEGDPDAVGIPFRPFQAGFDA